MTIILVIEYDGTNYAGWQIQPNAKTIQSEINKALNYAISGSGSYSIIGAGRTDAGVHASGQVAHFACEELHIPIEKLSRAINSHLPRDIRIKYCDMTDKPFHARYDAIAREYNYRIITKQSVFNRLYAHFFPYNFDENLLFSSANLFIGRHDFTTFSKLNSGINNYICDVEKCEWQVIDENTYELAVKSDRFVYGMIRAITGAMFDIARNKRTVDDVKFALERQDRSLASSYATASGLNLNKIYYGDIFMNKYS